MNYEQIGDEILAVTEDKTASQTAIVRQHYCYAKKLVIEGANTVSVNNPTTLTVKLKDWQDNLLLENITVNINISQDGAIVHTDVVSLVDGQAEFSFISEITGAFTVTALSPNMDTTSLNMEVTA